MSNLSEVADSSASAHQLLSDRTAIPHAYPLWWCSCGHTYGYMKYPEEAEAEHRTHVLITAASVALHFKKQAVVERFIYALRNSSEIVIRTPTGPVTFAQILESDDEENSVSALAQYLAEIAAGTLDCRPRCLFCRGKACDPFCAPQRDESSDYERRYHERLDAMRAALSGSAQQIR